MFDKTRVEEITLSICSARARMQDAPQEMEGNLATADMMARLYFAWLHLSFSPFDVGHPAHEHGIASWPSCSQ